MVRPGCLLVLLLLPLCCAAGRVTLEIGAVQGADWTAQGVTVEIDSDGTLSARVDRLTAAGLGDDPVRAALHCPAGSLPDGRLRCNDGRLDARLPWLGDTGARVTLSLDHARQWQAEVRDLRSGALALERLSLAQRGDRLETAAEAGPQPAAGPLALLRALWPEMPELELSGTLAGSASGGFSDENTWQAHLELHAEAVDFSDAEGRHAGENLAAALQLAADAGGGIVRLQPELSISAGQIYLEPVFSDFDGHALEARALLEWNEAQRVLTVQESDLRQHGVLHLSAEAELLPEADAPLRQAALELHEALLPAFADLYVQPFIAGGRLDPLRSGGRVSAAATVEHHAVTRAQLTLNAVDVELAKLHLALHGLDGTLHWAEAAPDTGPSALSWTGGSLARLPFGAASLQATAHGADLRLDAPLRVPLLDGALRVQRLALRNLGAPDMAAEFAADIEPLDLRLLSHALEWPELSGRLSGHLPGLRLEDGTVELDGALTAQVFDGEITLSQLRVIDAFGVVPRIAADLQLRGLDLLSLTGTFAFGSIEGRLHGEVTGLRMLGGRPVAFDARLYTPPGDRSRRRISQRAIDNISAVAGGPTGVLSRGMMRFFTDFPYRRLGWSCRLHDNVCHMDGVAPAGDGGYYLVQGRGLPHIDVIGYGRRVDWLTFIDQLRAVTLEDDDS